MKRWTGVGSRRRPPSIKPLFVDLARALALAGWEAYTGGADGIDSDVEEGCDQGRGAKRVILPWRGFNGNVSKFYEGHPDADGWLRAVHPAYEILSSAERALHGRNVQQVLGVELDRPSDLLVCWTPDGCETRAERRRTTGGTATAIVLAADHGVPIFNLAKPGRIGALADFLAGAGVAHNLPADKTVLALRQDSLF